MVPDVLGFRETSLRGFNEWTVYICVSEEDQADLHIVASINDHTDV